MAKLTTLRNKVTDEVLYPLTKTNAVSDSNGTSLDSLLSAINQNKQDKLTFDTTPTANSQNPVTSGGVYDNLSAIMAFFPTQWNTATKNTTYVDSGDCVYVKIGKVVIARFADVTFKNVNQPHNALLFSGLPKGTGFWCPFNITCWGGTHTTARYQVTSDGGVYNYWSAFTPTTSQKWSGVFVYLTNE